MFSLSRTTIRTRSLLSTSTRDFHREYGSHFKRATSGTQSKKSEHTKALKSKGPSLEHARRTEISRRLAYLLRHHGPSQGMAMRSDGFVRVKDVLNHHLLRHADFMKLEEVVRNDAKGRFTLNFEAHGVEGDCWWIRANQGHSIKTPIDLHLERVDSAVRVPVAIHGTTEEAWKSIAKHGISRMSRNHIHFAQGFAGKDDQKVFSGIRQSSRILIYVDVAKALQGGIKFYLSSNGVVLSPGNDFGFLESKYFQRVERVAKELRPVEGWDDGWNSASRMK